jgi:hypothetical protein
VIFDFTSQYVNGMVAGYWTDASTPAFDVTMSNKFRKDSMYVNFHTTTRANGEIRGNLTRTLCNDITSGISAFGTTEVSVKLFPNPAADVANLDITLSGQADVNVQLVDITGRSLWTKSVALTGGSNRVTIPTDALVKGVYFVKISNAYGQSAYKLSKE